MTLTSPYPEDRLYVTPTPRDGLIVRGGPGTQYSHVASTFIGDPLEVMEERAQAFSKIGQRGQWLKIRTPDGVDGWVASRFVQRAYPVHVEEATDLTEPGTSPGPSTPDTPKTTPPVKPLYLRTTSSDGLYVRSGPGSQFKPLTIVMPHHKLEALEPPADVQSKLGKYTEWIEIKTPQGVVGWSAAWYLEEMLEPYVWPLGHALAGLHGPAEPWADRWNDQAYQIIQQGRIEAVKMLASEGLLAGGEQNVTKIINRLYGAGVRFIMARLFFQFDDPHTPQDFVDSVAPAARCLFARGIQYFEVHNEPNMHMPGCKEGMWVSWQNGREFGTFFQQTVELLKQQLPDAQFGFPGVSPGFDIPKVRGDSERFLLEANEAIKQSADFVCMHTYWGIDGTNYLDSIRKIRTFCNKYPQKLVFVSEFSNAASRTGKDIKGREYAQFYAEARKLAPNLGGLFSYVLSAGVSNGRQDFPDEIWINSPIAQHVGTRAV
jgi:hypothetical protein